MKKAGTQDSGWLVSLPFILRTTYTYKVLFIIFVVTLFLPSCHSKRLANTDVVRVPEWANTPPTDERYYYAVGRSGPLIPENDAWEQAKERARAEIGRYIVSNVKSSFTSIQTTGGSYEDEIIETLSDARLNYTEVVSQWHDVAGINGSRDYFYVLIRIEKNRAKELLMQFGR